MSSKRFKKLPEKTTELPSEVIEKLLSVVKKNCTTKFDESVDLSFQINNKQKKSEVNIRTVVNLPGGSGKKVKVAVVCEEAKISEAKEAGADIVGFEDLAEKIKAGEMNFEVLIATPDAMRVVGQLGQILGPRGLMPNPKVGTVTPDVETAVKNAKGGQVRYRTDKAGIIHCSIGSSAFEAQKLQENLDALLADLKKAKPASAKGVYLKKVSMSSTMGPGIKVDQASLV